MLSLSDPAPKTLLSYKLTPFLVNLLSKH